MIICSLLLDLVAFQSKIIKKKSLPSNNSCVKIDDRAKSYISKFEKHNNLMKCYFLAVLYKPFEEKWACQSV